MKKSCVLPGAYTINCSSQNGHVYACGNKLYVCDADSGKTIQTLPKLSDSFISVEENGNTVAFYSSKGFLSIYSISSQYELLAKATFTKHDHLCQFSYVGDTGLLLVADAKCIWIYDYSRGIKDSLLSIPVGFVCDAISTRGSAFIVHLFKKCSVFSEGITLLYRNINDTAPVKIHLQLPPTSSPDIRQSVRYIHLLKEDKLLLVQDNPRPALFWYKLDSSEEWLSPVEQFVIPCDAERYLYAFSLSQNEKLIAWSTINPSVLYAPGIVTVMDRETKELIHSFEAQSVHQLVFHRENKYLCVASHPKSLIHML